MAYEEIPLIFWMVIVFVVLVIAIFLVFGKQIDPRNRVRLIRAYKAAPRKTKDAPVLVHGPAESSQSALLTTGERVAFHATYIMSKGCTFIRDMNHNKPLPETTSFKIFMTSGDFSVTDTGIPCRVSIISALERLSEGADMFSKNQKMNAVLDGMPESVFDDMVSFEIGSKALAPVFAITGTGRSVTSAIDSRFHTFTQGRDVPEAIAGILKGKIIRPQTGEEITVVEFYIPLKKSVFVFGTFDGKDTIGYGKASAGLSVSYGDPGIAGN